jgi:hypothetical protein
MSLAIWSIVQMMSPFYSLKTAPQTPGVQTAAQPVRLPARLTLAATRVAKPLRVARVPDDLNQPDRAGRMVMSGRMDEVCAELDRLVLLEARRQNQTRHSNGHSTALAA